VERGYTSEKQIFYDNFDSKEILFNEKMKLQLEVISAPG
jgi:hypothetical protein